ncbi:MAG: ABC transporter ATP-binding protein [Alphaproteobacteria bacterium]
MNNLRGDGAAADYALIIRGLRKTYGAGAKAKEALCGIDLDVPKGAFFGLLGPNGAGKSTLINILAGLVNKSEGTASIWGYDIDAESRAARCAIGVVPQEINVDPFFTPRELLELQAGLYGLRRAERRTDEILEAVGLIEQANAYARALSGGMRRRLLVAKAMVHSPPVLVLDEPTAGVDIELRHKFWDYVGELNQAGTTILLTTHYLEEAESFCNTIAIIDSGQLVACEETATLLRRLDSKSVTLTIAEEIETLPEQLSSFDAKLLPPQGISIHYHPSQTGIAEILASISAAGLTIKDLTTEESDLEDIFLALTSRHSPAS